MLGLSLLLALAAAGLPTGNRPAAQQTATVRGRVVIDIPPGGRRPSSAYPSRAVAQAQLAPPSEVENVVVFLKDAPARPVPPRRTAIRQRGETFLPRVIAVPVGSTVDFPNDDPIYHNVFSRSETRPFDLGLYQSGQARELVFDREGIVRVGCNLHANMSATVVVVSAPHYAITDRRGRFFFRSLEPGRYRLRAYGERGNEPTTQELMVSAGDNTVSVALADAPLGPLADKFGIPRALETR